MKLGRRHFLAAIGAIPPATRLGTAPDGVRTIYLVSQGLAGSASLALHREAMARGCAGRKIDLLGPGGFGDAASQLRRPGLCHVVALLTDADALVMESLLVRQGVSRVRVSRAGGSAVRLTATL